MKNIEVGYCIRRDGNVILQDVASVKITDRQIPEIAKYILSDVEYQTGELVCVPSKIYDRITSSVYEDAISKLGKRKYALYGDDEVELEDFLPDSLLKLLPELYFHAQIVLLLALLSSFLTQNHNAVDLIYGFHN